MTTELFKLTLAFRGLSDQEDEKEEFGDIDIAEDDTSDDDDDLAGDADEDEDEDEADEAAQ